MDATSKTLLAVLTRPHGRSLALSQALTKQGWQVMDCPALEIAPVALAADQLLPSPASYDLVVFVSVPAIEAYHQQLLSRGLTAAWPKQTKIACVGQASAQAIQQLFGSPSQLLQPDIKDTQDSEGLWAVLSAQKIPFHRVLVIRGQDGRDWLASKLLETGAVVDFHVGYCRKSATWSAENLSAFKQCALSGVHPVWLLTSQHGIDSTLEQLEASKLLKWASNCRFILTHPRQEAKLKAEFAAKLRATSGRENEIKLDFLVSGSDQTSILSNFEYFRDNESLA